MTLRTRLVLALVVLSAVSLGVFGVVTTTLYKRAQFDQLDDQLVSNLSPLVGRLEGDWRFGADTTDCGSSPSSDEPTAGGGSPGGPRHGFGPGQSFDGYAQLLDSDGTLLACSTPFTTEGRPDLPDDLASTTGQVLFTTGSVSGNGNWRVLVAEVDNTDPFRPDDDTTTEGRVVVMAVSTAGVNESLGRLARIEVVSALFLLASLGAGAWLILWRGLRPLEQMATTAETITAGDLSARVEPANHRTEVGQLGLALNTMLDGLEQAFRERDATEAKLRRFLADASHELRTPLTSIQGFAELFRMDGTDQRVDLPVIMRRIEQEAHRMGGLVEDLLMLARLDETREVSPTPVDLTVLAADACTDAVAAAPDRRVTLDAPAPAVTIGNPDQLRQAVANLVTNAVRHTPAGTPIEVATRQAGERVTVSVRDHGPGLESSALEHVFDRFWQADQARTGTGAGLGLAIVAAIAEAHQGTATAANAIDGGAVFTLNLPAGPR